MVPNGYNLRAGQGCGIMSDITKRKISIANTGKIVSEETKYKQSKAHKGIPQSPITIEKLKDFCAKNCGNCKYRIELSGYQDKYIHCQKSGYFYPKINGEYSYCSHFEKV
jgi:hypothetical protein